MNYVDNSVSGSGSVYLLKAGENLNYDAQLFNYCNIPIDIPYLTACLFFSGSVSITMYSTNADFSAPTGYKYIGNTSIASIQQTNTSNYNKLIKYAFSTTTGAYFSAGFYVIIHGCFEIKLRVLVLCILVWVGKYHLILV